MIAARPCNKHTHHPLLSTPSIHNQIDATNIGTTMAGSLSSKAARGINKQNERATRDPSHAIRPQ